MPTLKDLACQVLLASEPEAKTAAAHELSQQWHKGGLATGNAKPPKQPGRPAKPDLVSPRDVKRRRLGSVQGRTALLHAIAHIEFNAIDLAADMLARYADDPRIDRERQQEFISDWVGVCDDEARHFTMINTRLTELGSFYGALPAHNGLWEAAISTMDDLAARLVIAPMVLEARGLDVTPGMIEKLKSAGDHDSAKILGIIYEEEIAHVAAGSRWFAHICQRESRNPEIYFKSLLKTHYAGTLKPPFNVPAREKAGLLASFYQPESDIT